MEFVHHQEIVIKIDIDKYSVYGVRSFLLKFEWKQEL